jgi:hypothetical protein
MVEREERERESRKRERDEWIVLPPNCGLPFHGRERGEREREQKEI